MMAGFDCYRCRSASTAVSFRCWACGRIQHVHRAQWSVIQPGSVLSLVCCDCDRENLVAKAPFQPVEGERSAQEILI